MNDIYKYIDIIFKDNINIMKKYNINISIFLVKFKRLIEKTNISNTNIRNIFDYALELTKNQVDIDNIFIYINKNIIQSIMHLKAIQEEAYSNKFFVRAFEVYKIHNNIISEENLSLDDFQEINTTNIKWFNNHFIGFEVVLIDLKREIPTQRKYVEVAYLEYSTSNIVDMHYRPQIYRHKAIRRAFGDFNIPKDRNLFQFKKIEIINDSYLNNNTTNNNSSELSTKKVGNKIIIKDKVYIKDIPHLKKIGFKLIDKQWVKEDNKNDVALQLYHLLTNEFKLNKEQIRFFVSDILNLTRFDTKEISNLLENRKELLILLDKYKDKI